MPQSILDNPDEFDVIDVNTNNSNTGGGLTIDPLLYFTAAFQPPHAVFAGSNGAWDWLLLNDLGIAFAAPTSGTVTITRPDGVAVTPIAILVDNNNAATSHRVGIYYTLSLVGAYQLFLNVTIPGANTSTVITQTELLVAA